MVDILRNYIKKIIDKKNVLLFIQICFIICIEIILIGKLSYTEKKENKTFYQKSIINSIGYDINKNNFNVIEDDPQLYFDHIDFSVKNVSLVLDKAADKDTFVTIYGAESQNYSEENSAYKVIKNGEDKCDFIVNKNNIHDIRLDIDGDFSFKCLNIDGVICKYNIKLFISLLIMTLMFNICVLIVLLRKGIISKIRKINSEIYLYITNLKISTIFIIVELIGGIMFSSLVPAFQVPDEYTHITMIEDELGLEGYASEINEYYREIGAYNIQGKSNIKQNLSIYKSKSKKHFSKELTLKIKPKITAIRHLPNEIGLIIGIALGLPIFWCLFLAELCAVLFYAFIGKITLDLMPIKKSAFCLVMLLPMTLQQTSGINYDCFLLPICFVLTAYILNIIYTGKSLNWKRVCYILCLVICIVVTKIPYVFIALLVFAIPHEKYDLKIGKCNLGNYIFQLRYILGTALSVVAIIIIHIGRNNNYIQCLLASIKDEREYLALLVNTIKRFWVYYIQSSIGYFGWLDSGVSIQFCILCLLIVICLTQEKNSKDTMLKKVIKKRIEILGFMAIVFIVYFIFLSMFSYSMSYFNLDYTSGIYKLIDNIKAIDSIVGVQGRYFIPCIALVCILLPNIFKINNEKIVLIQIIYYPCMLLYIYNILIERYWDSFAI